LCINLVTETSLFYVARSEKHQNKGLLYKATLYIRPIDVLGLEASMTTVTLEFVVGASFVLDKMRKLFFKQPWWR